MKSRLIALLLFTSLATPALQAKELTPYRHGYEQGRQAGCQEGRERVGSGGYYEGDRDGLTEGAAHAQQQLIEAARNEGLKLGQADGERQGSEEGRDRGLARGTQEGQLQGQSKARSSALDAAKLAVTGRALADGKARAAVAQPESDGLRLGSQAGLERAKREANEKDFARACKDYRERQFASQPKGRTSVRQAPLAVEPNAWPLAEPLSPLSFGGGSCPSPDWRYAHYGSDNEEYQKAYREGYTKGVREGFSDAYDGQYQGAHDRGYQMGVATAQVANLQETVDEPYEEGFTESHEQALKSAELAAHQEAFTPAFETSYSTTYANLYPQFEREQYQSVEEAAFQELYEPRFRTAFDTHEQASFLESYPKQAKRAYDEGWRAEAKDFVQRPVRVVQAWLTPTDLEEVKLLSVKLRNFSADPVAGSRDPWCRN